MASGLEPQNRVTYRHRACCTRQTIFYSATFFTRSYSSFVLKFQALHALDSDFARFRPPNFWPLFAPLYNWSIAANIFEKKILTLKFRYRMNNLNPFWPAWQKNCNYCSMKFYMYTYKHERNHIRRLWSSRFLHFITITVEPTSNQHTRSHNSSERDLGNTHYMQQSILHHWVGYLCPQRDIYYYYYYY